MDNTTIANKNKQTSADLQPKELSEAEKIQAMIKQATPEFDAANYQRVYYPKKRTSWPSIHKRRFYPNLTWKNPNATAPSRSPPVVPVTHQNFARKNTLEKHPKIFNMNRGAILKPKDQPAVINHAAAREEENKKHPIVKQPVNLKIPEDLVCGWCKGLVSEAVWTPCCSKCYCSKCIELSLQLSNNDCCGCNRKNLSILKLIPAEDLRKRADTIKSNMENAKPKEVAENTQKAPLKINHQKVEKFRKNSLENQGSLATTPAFQHQPAHDMVFNNNNHPSWGQIQSAPSNFGFQRSPFHGLNGSPEGPRNGQPPPQQQQQWGQTPRMWMPSNLPPSFGPNQSPPMIPFTPPPGQRFYGSPPPGHMPNWPPGPHSHMRHGPPTEYYGGASPPMNHNDYELIRLTTNEHGSQPQSMDEPFRDKQPKSRLSIIDDPVVKFNLFLVEKDHRKMMAQHTAGARKRPRSRSNSPAHKRTFRYSPKRRHSRRSSSRSPIRSPTTQKQTSAAPTRTRSFSRRNERSRSPVRNLSPPPRQDNRSSSIDLPDEGHKRKERRTHSLRSSNSSSSSDTHYSKKERKDKKKNEKRRKGKD